MAAWEPIFVPLLTLFLTVLPTSKGAELNQLPKDIAIASIEYSGELARALKSAKVNSPSSVI